MVIVVIIAARFGQYRHCRETGKPKQSEVMTEVTTLSQLEEPGETGRVQERELVAPPPA